MILPLRGSLPVEKLVSFISCHASHYVAREQAIFTELEDKERDNKFLNDVRKLPVCA